MPQIAVRTADRVVLQMGEALGERADCVIEEATPETMAALWEALPATGAGVSLSEDHATITPQEPSPAALEIDAQVARGREQRARDLEAIAAHAADNPAFAALARVLGVR